MNKVMGFLVSVGSIISVFSTTLIIYAYCLHNHIQFLMPLVFEKISFNTFLLFFIPILLIIVFPVYAGVWGGVLALDTKENPDNYNWMKTVNSFLNFFGIYAILLTLLSLLILFLLFASNHIFMIFILAFLVVYLVNYFILNDYLSNKKDVKELIFINLLPAFLPSIGGSLFIIPYYYVFTDLFGSSSVSILALFLPIIFSSYAFFYVLFVERGVFFLIITISALFLFGFPQLLMNSSISNAYFLKMKYGFIPVSIVVPSDCVGKYPEKTNAGTILFNSGSELYVSLDLKLKGSPVSLYLKKGKCSEKVYPSQIIRIPYKDLATIPRY